MPTEYSILFLGDIVGKPGRLAVAHWLPELQREFSPLFTVVNGENAAGGLGITPSIADELFRLNVDAITLGNHAFNKREIASYLESDRPIVRPGNMASSVPGRGVVSVVRAGIRLHVMNLCGRVMMDPNYGDPFAWFDRWFEANAASARPHLLLDFHAEVTSEKIGMGYHVEGRATAVLGTHTHVQTADEKVLTGGTAYLTDVGMCGPRNSVLGMNRDIILRRFRTGLPEKFEVAEEDGVICGVVLRVKADTGESIGIERVQRGGVA